MYASIYCTYKYNTEKEDQVIQKCYTLYKVCTKIENGYTGKAGKLRGKENVLLSFANNVKIEHLPTSK